MPNPISIGRKSRAMFDGFFDQMTTLTRLQNKQMNENNNKFDADLLSGDNINDPRAKFTTVFVTGATGRVGKVIVRKLLLRGYAVRALIQRASDSEFLPPNVERFVGDVSDFKTMKEAAKGCAKIIYCARALTTLTSDLYNVELLGVRNACKAMQDYFHTMARKRSGQSAKAKKMLTDFKWATAYEGERAWRVELSESSSSSNDDALRAWRASSSPTKTKGASSSSSNSSGPPRQTQNVLFKPSEFNWKYAEFSGYVAPRKGVATLTSPDVKLLHSKSSKSSIDLTACEGLSIRYKCDGKKYYLVVVDSDGNVFRAPLRVKLGWKMQSIPWSRFVSDDVNTSSDAGTPKELNISKIGSIGIQFRAKANVVKASGSLTTIEDDLSAASVASSSNQFSLILEYLKANPRGEEADIVLLSCFGAGMEPGEERDRVIKYKKEGESSLRRSGLQYTIIRPGALLEEPSGAKALIFDQGERLTQSISCADVADVCVKAIHDVEARNRSFDVAYGRESKQSDYELVTQVAAKNSANYLTPALQPLERNT